MEKKSLPPGASARAHAARSGVGSLEVLGDSPVDDEVEGPSRGLPLEEVVLDRLDGATVRREERLRELEPSPRVVERRRLHGAELREREEAIGRRASDLEDRETAPRGAEVAVGDAEEGAAAPEVDVPFRDRPHGVRTAPLLVPEGGRGEAVVFAGDRHGPSILTGRGQ